MPGARREVDGERRVRREADSDERVAATRLSQFFRPKSAHIVDERGLYAELREGVGQVMRDAERPSLAQAMDRPRLGQKRNRLVKLAPLHIVAQARQRRRRGIGESKQKMRGIAAVTGVLLKRPEALGIVRPSVAQARTKHFLQLGEAGKAERLGEAHQGRGLHLGVAGEGGGGAERELVRVLKRVSRGLAQPFGQLGLDLDQATLEIVEARRRSPRCLLAHVFPRSPRDGRARLRYSPPRGGE